MIKKFDPEKLGAGENFKKLFGAYSDSKLALSLWTEGVAKDFVAQVVSILSVNTGPTKSPLTSGEGMPWWLKMIAKVAFKPPSVAVAKLHEVALDSDKHPSGSFVLDAKVKPLPFTEYRDAVLSRLERIYSEEYLKQIV